MLPPNFVYDLKVQAALLVQKNLAGKVIVKVARMQADPMIARINHRRSGPDHIFRFGFCNVGRMSLSLC